MGHFGLLCLCNFWVSAVAMYLFSMLICFRIQEVILSKKLHGKEKKNGTQGLKKTYRVISVGDLSPTSCVGGSIFLFFKVSQCKSVM